MNMTFCIYVNHLRESDQQHLRNDVDNDKYTCAPTTPTTELQTFNNNNNYTQPPAAAASLYKI